MFPNKVVRLVGVNVEFVLPCRSDPLGWHGDESEQETLDPVRAVTVLKIGYQPTAKS